ncbi:MAG: DUF488 domain-containing protein [Acidobacteriota bacterium]|jgi:uncharacterized protein (DUF488 family)
MATVYTIGHSTRTLDDFIAALKAHSIRTLVDIRSYPASRRMLWFQGPQHPPFMTREEIGHSEALEATLPRAGIDYRWMRALGGRRRKIRDDSPNQALRSPAFRNYADYMLTLEFQQAANGTVALAESSRTAIMCAEARVYYQCHRMLVSDYLVAHGHTVLHIADLKPAQPHRMTPEAHIENGLLTYPAELWLFKDVPRQDET